MYNDTDEFVNALDSFVRAELRLSMQPADYNNEAVQIVDSAITCFATWAYVPPTKKRTFTPSANSAMWTRTRWTSCRTE